MSLDRPEPPYYAVIISSTLSGLDPESITAWKQDAEHLEAQRLGKLQWYADYRIEVARVERAYGFERAE